MDVAARRREARRKRLLQDPEERLKKIRDLKFGEDFPRDHEVAHKEDPSAVAAKGAAAAEHDEGDTIDPASLQCSGDTDGTEHPCPAATTAAAGTLGVERTSGEPPPQTNSSSDPSSFIQNFIFSQLLLPSGDESGSRSRTVVIGVVAVLFRFLLEWEWMTAYTGESLVVFFAVAYPPLVFIFGGKNPLSSARLALWLVHDFALYLFMFIVTHGLVSAFTEQEGTEQGT